MAAFYYCSECDTIYDNFLKSDISYTTPCPKVGCCGEVFEVDELILPTIRLLNLKGYITKYCCSGHWAERGVNGYICFYELDDETRKHIKKTLPKHWYYVNDDIIRIDEEYFEECNAVDKFVGICEANIELYKWADNLKFIEEY